MSILQRVALHQYEFNNPKLGITGIVAWEPDIREWLITFHDSEETNSFASLALAKAHLSELFDKAVFISAKTLKVKSSVILLPNSSFLITLVGFPRELKKKCRAKALPDDVRIVKQFTIIGTHDEKKALQVALQSALLQDYRWDWGADLLGLLSERTLIPNDT